MEISGVALTIWATEFFQSLWEVVKESFFGKKKNKHKNVSLCQLPERIPTQRPHPALGNCG